MTRLCIYIEENKKELHCLLYATIFPGNNTPEGFFSYYEYILSQREADKIICIKGGPGTGKSTFFKKNSREVL